MPKEETFPIPIKYVDFTRTTHTSLDVLLKTPNDDYWNVDGEKELWRLTRKQATSRPNDVRPDMWLHMFDAAKKKAKLRWAIHKPKLDNAKQLKGIFFIEPNFEEFKLTMKAARRKLEAPMPAAIADKEQWRKPPQHRETQDKIRLCC